MTLELDEAVQSIQKQLLCNLTRQSRLNLAVRGGSVRTLTDTSAEWMELVPSADGQV